MILICISSNYKEKLDDFIYARIKVTMAEKYQITSVDKNLREYMNVEPVSLGIEHKSLLYPGKPCYPSKTYLEKLGL